MNQRFGLIRAVAVVAGLLTIGSASAQMGLDKRLQVTPAISYTLADNDRLTDDGIGVNVSVGRRFTDALMLELTGYFTEYDANDDSSTLEFKGAGLAALMKPLADWENLFIVVALHEGSTSGAPGARDDYRSTVFDAGVGYHFDLGGMLSGAKLRTEARYRMDSHESHNVGGSGDTEHYDGVFQIGLQIPIGRYGSDEEDEQDTDDGVSVVSAGGDSDNDGVTDDRDACPGTPAGAIVDSRGCETDKDGDGVTDRLDQCPGTEPGTKVDSIGCPAVPEGCRPPFPGEEIDEFGCASGDTVVLRGVTFEFDEARLTANAKVILDGVADTLLSATDLNVEVGGHTDSFGPESYNQALSERRAKAVVNYLESRGVDSSRMSAKGYGESNPIESNETTDGRELNRRVELKILD